MCCTIYEHVVSKSLIINFLNQITIIIVIIIEKSIMLSVFRPQEQLELFLYNQ